MLIPPIMLHLWSEFYIYASYRDYTTSQQDGNVVKWFLVADNIFYIFVTNNIFFSYHTVQDFSSPSCFTPGAT